MYQSQGNIAENKAAERLIKRGFTILERNWKQTTGEIDIVATRKQSRETHMYFFEVKYRRQTTHGDGFSYITPAKLRQMKFAARLYLSLSGDGYQPHLGAISVAGPYFETIQILEDVSELLDH